MRFQRTPLDPNCGRRFENDRMVAAATAGRAHNSSMTRAIAGSVTRMCFVFPTGEQCAGFAALTLLRGKI